MVVLLLRSLELRPFSVCGICSYNPLLLQGREQASCVGKYLAEWGEGTADSNLIVSPREVLG
jgi:hypothetical protein